MSNLENILLKGKKQSYKPTILIVDDNELQLNALNESLSGLYNVLTATSGPQAIDLIKEDKSIACVLMDIKMPGMDGIEATHNIHNIKPVLPVIYHTGYPGEYLESMIDKEENPFDYLTKGESTERLFRAIKNAVEKYELLIDKKRLSIFAREKYDMIGCSEVMFNIFRTIHQVAQADQKVLLLGETGTGKTHLAKAIHLCSNRAKNRFERIDCNHTPEDLFLSEFFGHLKGSFTHAIYDRIGKFKHADGGTVFLDEIGDISINNQGKLLTPLASKSFTRIGSNLEEVVNVRFIFASNKNLDEMVETGTFAKDLFFRINGTKIILPPLRNHMEDLPALINSFSNKFIEEYELHPKIFHETALDLMMNYDWPGNVRQLKYVVENAISSTFSDLIMAEDLRPYLESSELPLQTNNLKINLERAERNLILKVLARCAYSVNKAAEMLGIDRASLYRKIEKYNIDLDTLRNSNSVNPTK